MRNHLLSIILACGACVVGAQAQTADPSSGTSSTYPGTTPGTSSSSSEKQSGWSSRHISPTGRMGHEAVRGSQLTGAQITSSTGSEIGTISDTIVNPASGRLEFAVISLTGNPAASSSTSTSSSTSSSGSTTTPSATTGSSLGTGKQVAVPWMLLRSSGGAAAGVAATSGQQPSFVFTGDATKLESAPTFDANTDLSQPSWRQNVFSYFGLSGRGFGGTGAAESPGGNGTGSQTPDTSGKP